MRGWDGRTIEGKHRALTWRFLDAWEYVTHRDAVWRAVRSDSLCCFNVLKLKGCPFSEKMRNSPADRLKRMFRCRPDQPSTTCGAMSVLAAEDTAHAISSAVQIPPGYRSAADFGMPYSFLSDSSESSPSQAITQTVQSYRTLYTVPSRSRIQLWERSISRRESLIYA